MYKHKARANMKYGTVLKSSSLKHVYLYPEVKHPP